MEFRNASVYELPLADGSFDAVFSHALLEHLSDPEAALLELRRVLKPGSLIGLRAGDLGGLLIDAASEGPAQAFGAYLATQKESSKHPTVGRNLGRLMRNAGVTVQKMTASYEVISEMLLKLGPSLAEQFAAPGSFCSLQDKASDDSLLSRSHGAKPRAARIRAMPFYRDHIYPHLVSRLDDPEPIREIRQRIVPLAQGEGA